MPRKNVKTHEERPGIAGPSVVAKSAPRAPLGYGLNRELGCSFIVEALYYTLPPTFRDLDFSETAAGEQ